MAGRIIRDVRTVRIAVRKRIREERQLASGGSSVSFRSEIDHYEDVDVQVEINLDAVFASLGERAARNRSLRAIGLNGAIRAVCCSPHRKVVA